MRTALICAICFFCGAALFAPTAQLFKLGPASSGPYALRPDRAWSLLINSSDQEFDVPQYSAAVPCTVITSFTAGGHVQRQRSDGSWVNVIAGTSRLPEPGLRLSPGHYRWEGSWTSRIGGYYAPMLSNTYPGSDTYIDGTRIWSCHPVLDEGFEFEVPAGKVFMLTYAARDIKRLSDNVWLGVSGIGTTQSAMPGIPLPPGRYQLYNDSADYLGVSGYVTTDN